MQHLKLFVSLCAFGFIVVSVDGQATPTIIKQTEPIVARAGSFAILNCTVSNLQKNTAEFYFVNYSRVITSNCQVTTDQNDILGLEKYQIFCPQQTDPTISLFSLRVNNVQYNDNGIYQCRIRVDNNPVPITSINIWLTVLVPPRMITASSDITKDTFIGMNVTLDCIAQGSPSPNVTWGRANGRPLPRDHAVSIRVNRTDFQTTQRLVITNVTKDDRGTYRCSADNNIRPPDLLFSKLSVEFPPTVIPVEPSYGAPVGENRQAMIWCKVDGNPIPSMSWYSLGQEMSKKYNSSSDIKLTSDDFRNLAKLVSDQTFFIEQKIMTVGSMSTMESLFYSLNIHSVVESYYGFYVCRATNTHGDGWSIIQLYQVNDLFRISGGKRLLFVTQITLATFLGFVFIMI